MVENLEKRIVVIVLAVAASVAVGATFIYLKKRAVDTASHMSQGADPAPPTVPSADAAASAITVGTKASEEKELSEKEEPKPQKKGMITEVKWEDLYKLDYKTGKAPDSLKKLHKTRVKIPGFIVPLSDDMRALKEFLLVPNAQACIHVPPPPPNLIVYVVLDKALPIEQVSNPSWVEGTLLIESTTSEYGAASYKMQAEKMEEYKF